MLIELGFPILGRTLPKDNGYLLYAALSRRLGSHLPAYVGIASVGGARLSERSVALGPRAALRLRTCSERIPDFLRLAGSELDVGGHRVSLGVPKIRCVAAAPSLFSRLVCIKGYVLPDAFIQAVRRQLVLIGVTGTPSIPAHTVGPKAGLPQRRIINISGYTIVGFAVLVEKLDPVDSEMLLTTGIGGRRHMGCGLFFPAKPGGGPR